MRPPIPDETYSDVQDVADDAALVTVTQLYVVIESERVEGRGARYTLSNIDEVAIGRGPTRSARREIAGAARRLTVTLPDRRASTVHARLERADDKFVLVDGGSRNGTKLNGAPLTGRAVLSDGDLIEVGHTLLLFREDRAVLASAPADVDRADADGKPGILTLSPDLEADLAPIHRVARAQIPVLIQGESGTGKELIARRVHELSGRTGPFVAVNCGALTPNLVESQLFGHMKGAFSGAIASETGLVRSAHGGTLFLDEIGDLPSLAQASLLRVLQEHEVLPVGASAPVKVDIRVVAATHQPVRERSASGEFRHDLYARLAGWVIELPPLRHRIEDLGVLVAALAPKATLAASVARALASYSFPLNIRELEQALGLASALAEHRPIELAHLPPAIAACANAKPRAMSAREPDDSLRRELVAKLVARNGNVTLVAQDFGKARMQVQRWMKRFGLSSNDFREKGGGD